MYMGKIDEYGNGTSVRIPKDPTSIYTSQHRHEIDIEHIDTCRNINRDVIYIYLVCIYRTMDIYIYIYIYRYVLTSPSPWSRPAAACPFLHTLSSPRTALHSESVIPCWKKSQPWMIWLVNWLVDWLVGRLVGWRIGCLVGRLVGWLVTTVEGGMTL